MSADNDVGRSRSTAESLTTGICAIAGGRDAVIESDASPRSSRRVVPVAPSGSGRRLAIEFARARSRGLAARARCLVPALARSRRQRLPVRLRLRVAALGPTAPAAIIFTSGTTGYPKAGYRTQAADIVGFGHTFFEALPELRARPRLASAAGARHGTDNDDLRAVEGTMTIYVPLMRLCAARIGAISHVPREARRLAARPSARTPGGRGGTGPPASHAPDLVDGTPAAAARQVAPVPRPARCISRSRTRAPLLGPPAEFIP